LGRVHIHYHPAENDCPDDEGLPNHKLELEQERQVQDVLGVEK
jgi:hypothetical protein